MKPDDAMTAQTMTIDEARVRFDELLAFAAGGRDRRVIVERDGKPMAALIPFADLEWFDLLLRQRDRDFQVLHEIGRAFDGISDEEIEEEALKAVLEIRAEARAKRPEAAILHQ